MGYRRATQITTKRCKFLRKSKPKKVIQYRLFSETREHEEGILSNHEKECHGEISI